MNNLNTPVNSSFPQDAELFFEHSLAGFLITDAQNIIVKTNTRVGGWLGVTADTLTGKKFSGLLSIASKIYYETHLRPLLQMQGFFDEVLIELSNTQGQRLKVLVNAIEYKDKNDILQGVYYTLIKATDRILYEQNLQVAKITAEKNFESEKQHVLLREQLIGILGHDLRNPLGAITMATDLLQDTLIDTENTAILAILKRSTHRMTELIANIMDFARTRLGEGIIITLQDVMLEPVLLQVIGELKLIYPNREIITDFTITAPVKCDPDRIAQLLSNLLANALTHGSADTAIYVHATYINGALELTVINNGQPIPESLHKFLFEPFTREEDRSSKNGLGLGLYISAEIARAHNAVLSFKSTDEETRFVFYMPL